MSAAVCICLHQSAYACTNLHHVCTNLCIPALICTYLSCSAVCIHNDLFCLCSYLFSYYFIQLALSLSLAQLAWICLYYYCLWSLQFHVVFPSVLLCKWYFSACVLSATWHWGLSGYVWLLPKWLSNLTAMVNQSVIVSPFAAILAILAHSQFTHPKRPNHSQTRTHQNMKWKESN